MMPEQFKYFLLSKQIRMLEVTMLILFGCLKNLLVSTLSQILPMNFLFNTTLFICTVNEIIQKEALKPT